MVILVAPFCTALKMYMQNKLYIFLEYIIPLVTRLKPWFVIPLKTYYSVTAMNYSVSETGSSVCDCTSMCW